MKLPIWVRRTIVIAAAAAIIIMAFLILTRILAWIQGTPVDSAETSTEASAETLTEASAEAGTGASTDSSTDSSTEASIESSTEGSGQASAETSAENPAGTSAAAITTAHATTSTPAVTAAPTAAATTAASTEKVTEASTEGTGAPENLTLKDLSAVQIYKSAYETRYVSYAETHAGLSADAIVLAVNMGLDYPFYEHTVTAPDSGALSVLCNKYSRLAEEYAPDDLTAVPEGYYVKDGKAYKLRKEAAEAFVRMSDAAAKDGISLKVISGYRSYAYQQRLYDKYKSRSGQAAADRYSARPRHSEHETGLAADINDVSAAFENTDAYAWLQEHAATYGWILRYPKGKEATTGYMYESWHYRYLGQKMAEAVKASGLTYDAYYALYLEP